MLLPSNRTTAPEGGAEGVAPGVTILGCGSHTSVDSGVLWSFSVCCPKHVPLTNASATIVKKERLIVVVCLEVICNVVNLFFPVFYHRLGNLQEPLLRECFPFGFGSMGGSQWVASPKVPVVLGVV